MSISPLRFELVERIEDLEAKAAELQAEVTELRHAAGVANQTIAALQSWKESMEKDLAKYRELAIAAIDVTILAEECEGDDGEQVFTVNGERFTRLNDLADFFSADGTASILPDAEDSTQPKAQLDPDGNLAGPDFEDGPEFEGWEQRSGQPKSVEQCRDDGRCQYAIDHGAEGMGHCPPDKCCMPCTCDMPESICKAHYTTAKLSGEQS